VRHMFLSRPLSATQSLSQACPASPPRQHQRSAGKVEEQERQAEILRGCWAGEQRAVAQKEG